VSEAWVEGQASSDADYNPTAEKERDS